MSITHHRVPRRSDAERMVEELRPRTIVEGFMALLALVALLGAAAGAATWGLVRLISLVVS